MNHKYIIFPKHKLHLMNFYIDHLSKKNSNFILEKWPLLLTINHTEYINNTDAVCHQNDLQYKGGNC